MENINVFAGNNIGSLLGINLIDASKVSVIPTPGSDYIIASELTASEANAYVSFTLNSADFKEKRKPTANGSLWDSILKFDVPKNSPEIANWIQTNQDKGVIALIMDGNTVLNISGTIDFPMYFGAIEATRPGKVSGINKYDFELVGQSDRPSYFYGIALVDESGNRKIFSNGFSYGFLRTP